MINTLDLSTMIARLVLAILTTATFVLLGLWLREGEALGFAATLVSVTVAWYAMSTLRGQRLGPPTAAARRLQPLVDALAEYPGGRLVGETGFQRGVRAVGVGVIVALGEQLLSAWLLSGVGLPPLWRGLIALALILLPVYILMEWLVSRQSYTGTRFASRMLEAIWRIVYPDSTTTPWAETPQTARVVGFGAARTAATLIARVAAQLLIPAIFASWVSIAFVAVLVTTLIAGWPILAPVVKALRRGTPTPTTTATTPQED